MKVSEYTNKGSRDENQDFVVSALLSDDKGIYVVTDGMGGYSDGAVASRVVAEAIVDYAKSNHCDCSPSELLKEAIPFANDALMLKRIELGGKKMGCVLTALVIADGYAYLTWLGDSRIYMYREGEEVYRTEDHSVVNELAKSKRLKASSYDKYSSIVTKSIMGDVPVDVAPIRKIEVVKGDVFILCTDGFHKEIDMHKALEFDESKREELDAKADTVSDNFSFVKVEI